MVGINSRLSIECVRQNWHYSALLHKLLLELGNRMDTCLISIKRHLHLSLPVPPRIPIDPIDICTSRYVARMTFDFTNQPSLFIKPLPPPPSNLVPISQYPTAQTRPPKPSIRTPKVRLLYFPIRFNLAPLVVSQRVVSFSARQMVVSGIFARDLHPLPRNLSMPCTTTSPPPSTPQLAHPKKPHGTPKKMK